MGIYINPKEGTKEDWLKAHSIKVSVRLRWSEVPEGYLPVVWMDNYAFTAAGIATDEEEFINMTQQDGRMKLVYIVSKKDINEILDLPLGLVLE